MKSAVAVGVAITAGTWIHSYDSNKKRLHDLSVVGGGKPVVVQVHDPSCSQCRQLKQSTETALETIPQIEYRIADLTTGKGRSIAEQYNVGKVTLLLFDERGTHTGTVNGVKSVGDLRKTFENRFKL